METVTLKLGDSDYPQEFTHMHSPPTEVYYRGGNLAELMARPRVAIVGSRKITPYGRLVTSQIARELARQGIVIISGLALGVDAQAHEAALEAGGLTIAVLPSPVEAPVPRANIRLSQRITASGGVLLSNYPPGNPNHKGNFVARNELVAALCDVLIITEAADKSGSLHTAQFAIDLGKNVLAVPGNITSPTSIGANRLLKSHAAPLTNHSDVLHALGILTAKRRKSIPVGDNPMEQAILDLLHKGIHDGHELLSHSHMEPSIFNQTLTMLEITAKILPLGANRWGLP